MRTSLVVWTWLQNKTHIEGGERTWGRRQKMSMNNIPVCSQKNGKIGPSSTCRSLGRIWYPLFKNTSHWGCFWQLSRGFRACKQPLVQEKTKLVFRGKALSGQKTAGVGDSRVAQHCDLLRSHLLPALPADSLGLTAQTPEPGRAISVRHLHREWIFPLSSLPGWLGMGLGSISTSRGCAAAGEWRWVKGCEPCRR